MSSVVSTIPPSSSSFAVLLVSLIRQNEPVFNTAATFENVGILWVVVAFADDVGGPELEFLRQRSRACPLYIFGVVVRARILTAHHVHIVKALS
jgi:hypothetical protein